jgi:hypothetical protein
MSQLTANDLKTRGVAAIESLLATQPEAMISVRGKERYVVMEVAQYQYLRECELDAALAQSQADLAAGRFVVESAQAHMDRMEALLAAENEGNVGNVVSVSNAVSLVGVSTRVPASKPTNTKLPAKKTAAKKPGAKK